VVFYGKVYCDVLGWESAAAKL